MIYIKNKYDCSGCTACKSICPRKCINMVEDSEGFLYPKVNENCNKCGLCKSVCPILKNRLEVPITQEAYLVNNNNETIRKESTSGGAFTEIAKFVLKNGGVVFGATLDSEFNVVHKYIENEEDLKLLRGSKYAQSNLKDSFIKVKQFLEDGRWVCFSGTPCQVEGLIIYLGKDYEKLVSVDVVCRSVPSPLVYKKYLNLVKENHKANRIINVKFRDKEKYGYTYSTFTIETDKRIQRKPAATDPFFRAFYGGYSVRPSCHNCRFKKRYRLCDFTIWDCFEINKFDYRLDDNKGTTRVLIHTEKGKKIFSDIKNNFNYIETTPDLIVENFNEISNSAKKSDKRDEFFKDLIVMEEKQLFKKYFPVSIKLELKQFIKSTLVKLNLHRSIKKIRKINR